MASAVSPDDVIIQPSPAKRASQVTQTRALLALSETLAHEPENAQQQLVTTAMRSTKAESAGLSVEDRDADQVVLRWTAMAGELVRYLNGTMPRDFSPCGTAMDRRSTLIMRDPARHYPYMAQLHLAVRTALLVPFIRHGKFVGTLWVVRHSSERNFSTEDQRMVEGLATFASALLDVGKRTG